MSVRKVLRSLVVNLISPDKTYDGLFLSNYATINIKDRLLRLPGVGDIVLFGGQDYSMRIWLDPDKMTALNLSPQEILSAIQEQNVQVVAGVIGGALVNRRKVSVHCANSRAFE